MKKLIALILSVVLVMSLTACSGAKTYLSLDKALRNKNYTTQVNVDGSAMESATKDMKLQNVKSAVSISFANEEKNSKSSGFVFVFTFKNMILPVDTKRDFSCKGTPDIQIFFQYLFR